MLTAAVIFVVGFGSSASGAAPDGRIVYAVGGGEENFVVRTVRPDGTSDRRLIGPTRLGGGFYRGPSGPQWSSDGKAVLFGGHTHLDREATELWHATSAGRKIRKIPLGLHRPLLLYGWDWAPDRRRVVFAAGHPRKRSRIYTIAVDGSGRRALARGDRPSWSNDGRYIVFQRGYASVRSAEAKRGVFIMRSDGSGLRRLTPSPDDSRPSFSPDSKSVVFVRSFAQPPPPIDYREEWRIVDVRGRQERHVATVNTPGSPFRYGAPQWTPDGLRLAAVRKQDTSRGVPDAAFTTVGLAGGDERVEFTFKRHPSGYTFYQTDFSWQSR